MKCTICKKTPEEVELFQGISASGMINICEECAEDQKIPIIKKPSQSQLTKADRHYTVRERLDKMSGRRDTTEISRDQIRTQRNLAKLKMPKPKQYNEEVKDNYSWELIMARRRAKMTTSQLANQAGVSSYVIQDIEKGKIPENFKEIFPKLESLLNIKLLKIRPEQISYTRKNQDREQEILKAVAEKMKNPNKEIPTEEKEESKNIKEKIEKEEIKLSRKKDIRNFTLSDLIDRKRAKEKYEMKLKEDELLGDEIDLDEL